MVDLDHFKRINDTRGHQAGDAVLREAAHRMQAATRQYDAPGRYGGEEFLVVLPGCGARDGYAQAERIRQAFAGEPFAAGQEALAVTCSIGVSSREACTAGDDGRLIREADAALYEAKNRGRNRAASLCSRGAFRRKPGSNEACPILGNVVRGSRSPRWRRCAQWKRRLSQKAHYSQ